ncbi:hypothetical protein [Candidatus Nitronereus thalassa]|uniref:Uncharacterized protein n=1 Tax=Candidatus Nitronereus thalassa TaxID=3020898 RepID=A0ABU3K3N9_9BACT|nr:hypothetical protein [Candidatus Nitronereus thalassa]MDT7040974.1 hypothetical protein [Candidatus Nitronereus thalassa]
MNFSRLWPGSVRPQKKKRTRPKMSRLSLVLEAPTKPTPNAMEEIRRQAVSMSSTGPKLITPTTHSTKTQRTRPSQKLVQKNAVKQI